MLLVLRVGLRMRLVGGGGGYAGWIARSCLVWVGCFDGFWSAIWLWFLWITSFRRFGCGVIAVGLIVACLISGCFGFVGDGFGVDCCFWFADLGLLLTLLIDCDVLFVCSGCFVIMVDSGCGC